MSPSRVLSGIQPTAESFHLGNFLGALQQWQQMTHEFEAFYFVADLHAITVPQDPAVFHANTLASYAQIIAAGVDPNQACIFVQSHVPEHTQLSWLMQCLTGFGEASRMTQFKDKSAKASAGAASVGLFTYPVLQAADILLYQAAFVPVGEDQRQHLELTRDLALRFNNRYGEVFTLPEPTIRSGGAKVRDLNDPSAKMSKSNPAGCVFLRSDAKRITKQLKSAVTDSLADVRYDPEHQPGVANLLSIIGACTGRTPQAVAEDYPDGRYGPLKQDAAEAVLAVAVPFAQRTQELLDDPAELHRLMADGAEKARTVASATVAQAYEAMGFVRP